MEGEAFRSMVEQTVHELMSGTRRHMERVDHWEPIDDETPIDPSEYRDRSIRTRRQAAAVEAEAIRKTIVKYLSHKPSRRTAPFTYAWVLRLHREMFVTVLKHAGKIRNRDMTIGVKWELIGEKLASLVADVDYWENHGGPPVFEQAVHIHYRAVYIHPFSNGNGRWARLLANIWLLRHDLPIIEWPPNLGEKSPIRDVYISAMRAADAGDFGALDGLHRHNSPRPHHRRPR